MVTWTQIEPQNTLHLLAAAPRFWTTLMPELVAVWQEGDLILLLAEGAQGFNAKALDQFKQIAVLDSDLARLEVENDEVPNHIKIAAVADWATWTVHYERTVTWR